MQKLYDFLYIAGLPGRVFCHEREHLRYVVWEHSIDENRMTIDTGTSRRSRVPLLPHLQDIYIPTMTLEELKILQAAKKS